MLLSPAPAVSPTPTVAATPQPTPPATPTPSPEAPPEATPTPTPEPPPEPAPAPQSPPNALGIREIAMDEAFIRLAYAPGEQIGEEAVLFFLDVETGAVEGWQHADGLPLSASPDHRYVAAEGALHDRETGRTFTWDAGAQQLFDWNPEWRYSLEPVPWSDDNLVLFEMLGGDRAEPRRFALADSSMEPVASFELPAYWMPERWSPDGGMLLARGVSGGVFGGLMELFDLSRETRVLSENFVEHFGLIGLPEGFAIVRGDQCRVLRYGWTGESQSDVSAPVCGDHGTAVHLSPDGALFATLIRTLDCCDWDAPPGPRFALTTVSIADATGAELMRISGATGPIWYPIWIGDGSMLIVRTVLGHQIVSLDGAWAPLPDSHPVVNANPRYLAPSPSGAVRFVPDGTAVVDLSGEVLAEAHLTTPVLSYWGISGREVQMSTWLRIRPGDAAPIVPVLLPAIQLPPFDDALTAQVVVDTCLNVRAQPTTESGIEVCLPPGRVVELVPHPADGHIVEGPCVDEEDWACGLWVHVLTEDGEQGWAYSDFLRWPGIPLPATEAPPTPDEAAEG